MKKSIFHILTICCATVFTVAVNTGCATKTDYISDDGRLSDGTEAQFVAGFSEKDIRICAGKAIQSILMTGRIIPPEGSSRAIVRIKSKIDTISRGRDAAVLSEALELEFAQQLTDSGSILVLNDQAADYATTEVQVQYVLEIRLTERILRQDNGDGQKEYNLNLQLIDVNTGLTFWQRRVPLRKLVDEDNIML